MVSMMNNCFENKCGFDAFDLESIESYNLIYIWNFIVENKYDL
jgi:hypothetical protein